MGRVNIANAKHGYRPNDYSDGFDGVPVTAPATDLARAWSGHRYGLQALKPAVEPILVFQKPYEGRPVDNITQTGAGALNVDAGRIPLDGESPTAKRRAAGYAPNVEKARDSEARGALRDRTDPAKKGAPHPEDNLGRWPSNLILGDVEACEMIDRQSGTSSSKPLNRTQSARPEQSSKGAETSRVRVNEGFTDSGGASRFFFRVQTQIDEADAVIYRAKSGRPERDAGLDSMPLVAGGMVSETSGQHITRRDGCAPGSVRNGHPTVKPLSLTRYLASLLLPPADYAPRRLFVPFAGVASEMCGADLAGWEEISGVEMSADYCKIGEARRRFWSCHSGLFDQITQVNDEEENGEQESLF